MNRYLLFAGDTYYPAGGWNDLKGDYTNLEEAKWVASMMYTERKCDWWQIVDTHINKIIKTNKQ